MKVSIVIPVYGDHLTDFKRCWNSILDNTCINDVEIIVIANGCSVELRDYLNLINHNYYLYDEPLGATGALNEGIRKVTGDIVVLLNQDVQLLDKEWLPLLLEPFDRSDVGITGPNVGQVMILNESGQMYNASFIAFCCCAIRREVIESIGLLDMAFNPGGFEDMDYTIKVVRAGWKMVQVPENGIFYDKHFPMYHVDSHGEWLDMETQRRNEKIMFDRYCIK